MDEQNQDSQDTQPVQETPKPEASRKAPNKKKIMLIVAAVLSVILIGTGVALYITNKDNAAVDTQQVVETEVHEDGVEHTHLDYTQLPLGDDKYSDSPQIGYVYTCQSSFNGGGAFEQGPWIDVDNGTWDLTQKISVEGDVAWPTAYWDTSTNGTLRYIKSADLPFGHNTGTFPVASSDPAYNYDRNPNSIAEQTISFEVPANPTAAASPSCVGGEVGIATTGVLIFSAFDAGGKDAVATEIQDSCQGHPQAGSYYHYHGYSNCFNDESGEDEHSELLGFAFDGFGIYGLKGEGGYELSTQDLDECHGHTHNISWNGQDVEMYHYHMTQDFPYTVSCFKGEASVTALSSGEGGGAQSGPPAGAPPQR